MPGKIKKTKYFFEEGFIETVGEVSEEIYEPLPSNQKLKYIGKKISRSDGKEKVTGDARYTYDIELPRLAHARILRSPHAHALIKKIDVSRALKAKGVLKIIHAGNIKNINWYGNSSFLFDKHLRHEGDDVACVVAETEKKAENALRLIDVEYELLPSVARAEDAMKKDAVKIHDNGNIRGGKPATYSRGDIESGFDDADEIIEDTFSTEVVVHNPTEVHCSVADWDGDNLTLYDSTQGVFSVRRNIARALKIPQSKVRVIKKYMGGGFGSKLETGKYSVMAAMLAREVSRPVKILLDRREMNLAVGNRPDSVQKLKVGVKKDGTLTALSHYSYASIGAYPSGGGCSWPLRQIYKCPNVKVEEYSVMTNTGKGRPFRAPGHVQGTFALDSIIDETAEKIGMDPLEFRLKNYSEKDQVWGATYSSKLLKEAYRAGAEKIGWKNRNKVPGSQYGDIKRGIGMATQIWWGGGGPPAHVTLQLNSDGSAVALAGSQDLGTGTYTFVAQIVAEILEIPIEKISVVLGDTSAVPYGPSSGGSTTAPSISPATRDAAEKMKAKLISGAAAIYETETINIKYRNGEVFRNDKSGEKMSIGEVIREMDESVLTITGSREANPENYLVQTFGAQFAEVEVDVLTGNIKVLKIVAAHDIGRVLNRKTLENQFHGGIIQGLGFALMEEQIVDMDSAKILNANIHDYKMPTILETPEIEVLIIGEGDEKANNMGVKGIGEPAIIPTAAAIANALYNAIGARVKSLPITPDKVLEALYL